MLYCFTYSCFTCKSSCVSVCEHPQIYTVRACVCVCVHSLTSAADNANPVYFSFPLPSVFQIYLTPFPRLQGVSAEENAAPAPTIRRTHTHTHTHQNKGSPPHIRFPLWICKTQQWSQRWEITRTIWAIDRPPLWSNGPRLCLVSPPPPPLCFLWLCVDNQQGRRQSGLWDSDRVWLWCCTLPSKVFLSYDLQR